MTIRNIDGGDMPQFKKLFCDYFRELDCEDDPLPLFDDCVATDLKAGLLSVGVAEGGGKICAFVIFQLDDVINDWCFAEGKGDIREIFVSADERRKGIGRALMHFAENALKREGASEVYLLPSDESEAFFTSCGYGDMGEYCAELDSKVFGKNL